MNIAVLIIIGVVGGVLGGMGLGGGTLFIPLATTIAGLDQKSAAAINLAGFVPMAIVAVIAHAKNGLIDGKLIAKYALPALISCAAFSIIACRVDDSILRELFGAFLIILGATSLLKLTMQNAAIVVKRIIKACARRDLA